MKKITTSSIDNDYVAYVLDLLAPLQNVTAKKMFGGYGIYKDDTFFALIAYDTLYFKVNDTTRIDYENHESFPFTYDGKNGQVSLHYWSVPASILENEEALIDWANKAIQVALEAKKAKVGKRKK
ncbi:MAG: TfoX/Sxy family protein [Epsilonproteobacteria bacterium]|nr:TfoX/Sxy family protein [Campylobacterota bacterium]